MSTLAISSVTDIAAALNVNSATQVEAEINTSDVKSGSICSCHMHLIEEQYNSSKVIPKRQLTFRHRPKQTLSESDLLQTYTRARA